MFSIEKNFELYPKRIPVTVRFNNGEIRFIYEESQLSCRPPKRVTETYSVGDIIGANHVTTEERKKYNLKECLLCITIFKVKSSTKANVRTVVRHFIVVGNHDSYEANVQEGEYWRNVFRTYGCTAFFNPLFGMAPRTRYLVVINPYGGKKKGQQIFHDIVAPFLRDASVDCQVLTTQYAGHARHYLKNCPDIFQWNAVVAVGGDGLVYEIIHGLFDQTKNYGTPQLPIGVIPAGTGNALHATINQMASVSVRENFEQHSAFLLTRPTVLSMDLIRIETLDGNYYSFLGAMWGIVSDIDIESERYRNMGSARFTLQALVRIGGLRHYEGTFSYLPPEKDAAIVALNDPVPPEWITVEGPFVGVMAVSLPYVAWDMPLVPHAAIDDGLIHLVFLKSSNMSRRKLLHLLDAIKVGEHVHVEGVEMVKCKAFRFSPKTPPAHDTKRHIMTIDGEAISLGPLQGFIMPGGARILGRKK